MPGWVVQAVHYNPTGRTFPLSVPTGAQWGRAVHRRLTTGKGYSLPFFPLLKYKKERSTTGNKISKKMLMALGFDGSLCAGYYACCLTSEVAGTGLRGSEPSQAEVLRPL